MLRHETTAAALPSVANGCWRSAQGALAICTERNCTTGSSEGARPTQALPMRTGRPELAEKRAFSSGASQ